MSSCNRNFFSLPNEIFSLGLSVGELVVYAYLLRCENRRTYQCHPSYKTIGRAVGLSAVSASDKMKENAEEKM